MQGRLSAAKPVADKLSSVMQGDEKNKKKPNRPSGDRKVDRAGRYVFFQEEFEKIMIENEKTHLLDRLDRVIIKHSVREEGSSIFYLYWTDAEKHLHSLKVSFKTSDQFLPEYSKYLNSTNLKTLIPGLRRVSFNEKQKYASLTVEKTASREITIKDGPKKIEFYLQPLLLIWVTLDGYFGEFRDTRTEQSMSASEVLSIYRYFSRLLAVDNIFIIDDAVVDHAKINSPIPLRLISALATGKTWHERNLHGAQLMELKLFSITDVESIRQNKKSREQSLAELQSLKVTDWYTMLKSDEQKLLIKIYYRNFPEPSIGKSFFRGSRGSRGSIMCDLPFGELTLKELASKIYDNYKVEMSVTVSLESLYILLCGQHTNTFGITSHFENQQDRWVKSRVQQLLRESLLWKFEPQPNPVYTITEQDLSNVGASNECVNRRL